MEMDKRDRHKTMQAKGIGIESQGRELSVNREDCKKSDLFTNAGVQTASAMQMDKETHEEMGPTCTPAQDTRMTQDC